MSKQKSLAGKCDSCMMPFKKDPKGAERENEKFCSYCYSGGKLMYKGSDVNEFKRAMIDAMVSRGENKTKAKFYAWCAGFAPRWK